MLSGSLSPIRYAKRGEKMKIRFYPFLLVIIIIFVNEAVSEKVDEVNLVTYVEDLGNILSSAQHDTLESMLAKIGKETTNQVVLTIVNNLEGMKIEDFSIALVEKYKIGEAIKNNGILILMALQERQLRIEVGYGLEPVITDVIANLIIRDKFVPRFKEGNYYAGFYDGIEAIKSFLYQTDVKQYFSMNWDIQNFEDFI
jgi:uncharacterized protein